MDEIEQRINVLTPEGEVANIPASQFAEASQYGFKQATPEEVALFEKEQKYGTFKEQSKAFVEGLAKASTLGLSTAVEKAMGEDPRDIRARQEVGIGSAAGEVASFLTPTGLEYAGTKFGIKGLESLGKAADIYGKAGRAAEEAVFGKKALEAANIAERAREASALEKIGGRAINDATQMALLQSGDEVSKMVLNDPDQTFGTAMTNVGGSALLGSAFGAGIGSINPLWKATAGSKLEQYLNRTAAKTGVDGVISESLTEPIARRATKLSPETITIASEDPFVAGNTATLLNGTGRKAVQARVALENDSRNLSNEALNSFGKKVSELEKGASAYESGQSIADSIAKEVEKRLEPLGKEFEALRSEHGKIKLKGATSLETTLEDGTKKFIGAPAETAAIEESLMKLSEQEGWTKLEGSEPLKKVTKVIKSLKKAKTVEDIYTIGKQIADETYDKLGGPLSRAGQLIRSALNEEADKIIGRSLGAESNLAERFRTVKSAWHEQSKILDDLNEVLGVGGSKTSYAKNLREYARTDAEAIFRKLSSNNDVFTRKLLQEYFPGAWETIKNIKTNEILGDSLKTIRGGETVLDLKKLGKKIEALEPEAKASLFTEKQIQDVEDIKKIQDSMEKHVNPSGTSRALEAGSRAEPNTLMGTMAYLLTSGNPVATIASMFGKYAYTEARDALKYSLMKYYASGKGVSSEGFKAMFDYFDNVIKGERLINKATKDIFHGSEIVIPNHLLPKAKAKKDLEDRVDSLDKDPNKIFDVGGTTTVYLPEHGEVIGRTAATMVQYLKSQKPVPQKNAPLDKPGNITEAQKRAYERTLDIAEQPLMVLQHIKDGTLQAKDIQDLSTMYPSLYKKLQMKLTDQLANAQSKKMTIPYKTKMSLSMFMGQPLDSTMTPFGIQELQKSFAGVQQQSQQQTPRPKGSPKELKKLNTMYLTPQQSRELNKTKA